MNDSEESQDGKTKDDTIYIDLLNFINSYEEIIEYNKNVSHDDDDTLCCNECIDKSDNGTIESIMAKARGFENPYGSKCLNIHGQNVLCFVFVNIWIVVCLYFLTFVFRYELDAQDNKTGLHNVHDHIQFK